MEAGEGLSMGQEFADDIFITGRERRQFLSFTCLSGDSAKGSPRHAGSRHNGAIKERMVLPHYPGEEEGRGLRLCVDYRRLNMVTAVDAYPMPCIDDLINRLGRARYITTLDLACGYWEVPMAEEDQAKTAFTTPMGLY